MEFLLILAAWALFSVGAVNLVSEAYRFVTKDGLNTLQEGDWFVVLRLAFVSACFAGWYWILFSHLG